MCIVAFNVLSLRIVLSKFVFVDIRIGSPVADFSFICLVSFRVQRTCDDAPGVYEYRFDMALSTWKPSFFIGTACHSWPLAFIPDQRAHHRYGRKAHRHPARAIIRNIRDARVAHFNDIALPLTYRHKKFPLSSVLATDIIAGNDPSTDRCVIYKGYVEDLDHRGCNNLDLRWLETPFDSRGSEEALSMCIELWHNAYDRLEYWDHRQSPSRSWPSSSLILATRFLPTTGWNPVFHG